MGSHLIKQNHTFNPAASGEPCRTWKKISFRFDYRVYLMDMFLKAVGLDLIRHGKVNQIEFLHYLMCWNRHQYYYFVFNTLTLFLNFLLLQHAIKKFDLSSSKSKLCPPPPPSPTGWEKWQTFYSLQVLMPMTACEPFLELNIFLLI